MAGAKKIDEHTPSAFPNSLSLFQLPPSNVAITHAGYRELNPLNPLNNQPFSFRLYNDNMWIDLSRTFLQAEFSVDVFDSASNAWGAPTGNIAPIQSIGQTFIRQLKITLNNTDVYDSGTLFPYKSYLTNVLSFNEQQKATVLQANEFYSDNSHNNKASPGYKARAELVKAGSVQLFSKLDFDLSCQPLFLLNNSKLVFTLYKADDTFLLQSLDENVTQARMNIFSLKLYVKTLEVQPSLNLSIYNKLNSQPAKYAVRKTELRSLFLTAGRTEFEDVLFTNTIPRRLIMGMVSGPDFNGTLKSSPFEFKHFNLREMSVHAGGLVFPQPVYDLNFSEGK